MAFGCYGALVAFFLRHRATSRPCSTRSPQVRRRGVSPLDEGAKLLLLAMAGAIATYATNWQERLATSFSRATEEREQLEARLARAQLQSLRLQLHPHFLFNTLNTINALIGTDRHAAERVISGLSELLRMSLSSASEQEVTLAKELELLAHYIEIQQIRFQDRLTVNFRIDPDARYALVPNLMLQPLVENAIRHGIAPRAAPGHVIVTAARRGDRLELSVVDDGVGEKASRDHRDGVGLGQHAGATALAVWERTSLRGRRRFDGRVHGSHRDSVSHRRRDEGARRGASRSTRRWYDRARAPIACSYADRR